MKTAAFLSFPVFIILIGVMILVGIHISEIINKPEPSPYTIHHHPSEIQLFDKWEVVVGGDSICYSGSLSDCAAWVEMKEKGMMK